MRLWKLSCLLLGVSLLLTSCQGTEGADNTLQQHEALSSGSPAAGFEQIAADGGLILYADRSNGQIYLEETAAGKKYYSNPVDADSDEIATPLYKLNMKSQLDVRYLNQQLVTDSLNNYVGSVMNNTFHVEDIENGIRFEFDFTDEGFVIPVEYYLENGSFYARIPVTDIEEYKTNRVVEISLLPYFGAVEGSRGGYMLIPDGSGGLIYIQEDSSAAKSYIGEVYGRDSALSVAKKTSSYAASATLPMFAVVSGNTAVMANVEQGDALSKITAVPAGLETKYANAYTSVTLRNVDSAVLKEMTGLEKSVTVYNPEMADLAQYTVEYTFYHDDDANYSALARIYQKKLFGNNDITVERKNAVVELLLTTRIKKNFLIFPYTGVETLLDFDDVRNISEELAGNGLDNILWKLDGWQKYSCYDKMTSTLKLNGGVGSKKELKQLTEDMKATGSEISLGYDMLNIYKTGNGVSKSDGIRNVNGAILERNLFKKSTYVKDKSYPATYILNSEKFGSLLEKFAKSVKGSVNAISDNSSGWLLPSNNHRSNLTNTKPTDRQAVLEDYKNSYETVKKEGIALSFNGASGYAFPYADTVTKLPNDAVGYRYFDEQIPFVQMVLSGKVNYASGPMNLSVAHDIDLLKMVEFGEIPYYSLSELNDEVKNLAVYFNENYSINYSYHKAEIFENSRFLQEFYDQTKGAVMVFHQKVQDGVYRVVYSNQAAVYINYTEKAFEISPGNTVDGLSYTVVKEG